MTRLSTVVVAAAVFVLVTPAPDVSAQQVRIPVPEAQATLASTSQGKINGVILDDGGRPLGGAMVSALGPTLAFKLSGRDGRFSLDALPIGAYTVRVHLDGFVPSRRQVVDVLGGAPSLVSVAMQALSSGAKEGTAVLVAGMSPFDAAPAAAKAADDGSDHDHGDTAWRLRHLKRSVLKTVDGIDTAVADGTPENAEGNLFGRAFESSMRFASDLFAALPLTGQVHFVTTGAFSDDDALMGPGTYASSSVTYVSLGAPVGGWGQWNVRGAMRSGDVGSWFVSGAFDGRVAGAHRYSGGLAYGAERFSDVTLLGRAAIQEVPRSIGSVYGTDEWSLGRSLVITYGLAYAWQDYVKSAALLSPRVAVTVLPSRTVRVRTVAARYAIAPGGDELLPAAVGPENSWLPTQRSFSPLSNRAGFRAQFTDHYEVSVERVTKDLVVGFRTFYQRVDDQMGAAFALPAFGTPASSSSHYYVATVGDMSARGWTVSVSRPIIAGVRGSVDYSQTTARWQPATETSDGAAWFAGSRASLDRFHDLTTSVETDIPYTATRVYVLYKINTAFAREDAAQQNPGLDARFDVQVNQALPFLDFTSAEWEVLVAVRNLFRDPMGERSVFDELLVVQPPKRIVGGVRVRF